MKEPASDFLTHKQRVKFVGAMVPFINLFILPAIIFSATNKLIICFISVLTPIIGITFLKLSERSTKELLFKIIPITLNGLNAFLVCWLAGPDSPTYLIGITLIGAITLVLVKFRQQMIAIFYALIVITTGCYLAGKTLLEISSILALLLSYSFILVRILGFTMIQGREILSSHQKIELQKKVIEEKNKDIVDSIHYAKRIQNSLLPTEIYIDRNLKRLQKK